MINILVVEDEVAIQTLIQFQLEQAGFHMLLANNIQTARQQLIKQTPDLILLDWMLPDESGVSWINQLRSQTIYRHLPIILLTARGEDADKEYGLNQGADDYLTKPFSPRELIARIHALMRRCTPEKSLTTIQIGQLNLNPEQQTIFTQQHSIECSSSEFKLLYFLANHPDKIYSRSQLLDHVWGNHVFIEERTVDVQIGRIRRLLEKLQLAHYLQTVRGSGYRFSIQTKI